MTAEVHAYHSKSSQFLPHADRQFHSTLTLSIGRWDEAEQQEASGKPQRKSTSNKFKFMLPFKRA